MTAEVHPIRSYGRIEESVSDEEVARSCAKGDPVAIGALFDRYHLSVERYLRRLTYSPDEVEDLVQQVFMEVVRGTTIYDGSSKVRTWLFAVANNIARHNRRTAARRTRRIREFKNHGSDGVVPAHGEKVGARIELELAQLALESLRPKLKEAFVLCELEGLSANEAAVILGISEAAVWKRVSKARDKIRRIVQKGAIADA